MTYLFRCAQCGVRTESNVYGLVPKDSHGPMRRDYRAENAAPHTVALQREREAGGRSAVRDLFLPKAKDFESASDPDGSKGIRQWNDEHGPREGNKNPLRPEGKRQSF